jgi:hypothetical protein
MNNQTTKGVSSVLVSTLGHATRYDRLQRASELTQPTEACGLTLPIMKRARDARLLGVVAAALLVAGCGISSRPSQTTGQTTTQLKTSTPAVTHSTVTNHPTATAVAPAAAASPCGRGGRPLYRHVILIWMENHNYESVIGSPKAPYENRLVAQCGSATNYYAVTHPSLPNYLAATGGTTAGVRDDGDPSEHPLRDDSIFARLSPLTTQWRTYAETMPRNCAQTAAGLYAVKHNPAAYYLPIRDRCLAWDVPLGTTSVGPLARALDTATLPAFSFIVPNECSDTHDCSISVGDAWLSQWLERITTSAAYGRSDTAIFVVWDEGVGALHVPFLVVAPTVRAGVRATGSFSHYSLLRTTLEMLRLRTDLGQAATAPSMRASFGI